MQCPSLRVEPFMPVVIFCRFQDYKAYNQGLLPYFDNKILKSGQLVVMDLGCGGFCSDIVSCFFFCMVHKLKISLSDILFVICFTKVYLHFSKCITVQYPRP